MAGLEFPIRPLLEPLAEPMPVGAEALCRIEAMLFAPPSTP